MNDLYSAISDMGDSRFGRLQDTVNMINKTATANDLSFDEAVLEIYKLLKEDAPEENTDISPQPELASIDEGDHRDRIDSDGDVWKYHEKVSPYFGGHWSLSSEGGGTRNLRDINGHYGPLQVVNA